MTRENPIKIVRHVVEGTAEQLASNEHLEKPQEKHYDESFRILRNIKKNSPKLFQKVIEVTLQRKELKDLLGAETFLTFINVCSEITESIVSSYEQQKIEIQENLWAKFLETAFVELEHKIRNDSRILREFNGKDELLGKAIEYTKTEFSLMKLRYEKI